MIEKIILDHLSKNIDVPVYMEAPTRVTDSYVLIEKTGSSETNYIKEATLAIQSIAPTLYKAAQLNELVKAAMNSSVNLADIARAKCNSDYNFSGTSTKTYRYQAVYDVTYY